MALGAGVVEEGTIEVVEEVAEVEEEEPPDEGTKRKLRNGFPLQNWVV